MVAEDALLQEKAPYLNVPFFTIRAALYFAVWALLAWRSAPGRAQQDADPSASRAARFAASRRSASCCCS